MDGYKNYDPVSDEPESFESEFFGCSSFHGVELSLDSSSLGSSSPTSSMGWTPSSGVEESAVSAWEGEVHYQSQAWPWSPLIIEETPGCLGRSRGSL